MAWDQYAAAWTVALGFTHQERKDGEEDPATAAEYASALLRERRKRFRVHRKVPRRSKAGMH